MSSKSTFHDQISAFKAFAGVKKKKCPVNSNDDYYIFKRNIVNTSGFVLKMLNKIIKS